MNVIVSNKYQQLLANLDIEVIKNLNGEFTAEEIVSQFTNFFFNKMILDITAIKGYENISTMQELSLGLDMSKVILLLDDSEKVNSPIYLSQLVSIGVYNFTRNINSVKYLMENPNSYKDVASYHHLDAMPVNHFNSKSEESGKGLEEGKMSQKIIGIKNVTDHAGATTLAYMIKKILSTEYNVATVELDSDDFVYFNDKELDNCSSSTIQNYITNHSNYDVIVIDLNNNVENICTDIIYLIEPGLIKLNKLIRKNNKIFDELKDKKIVINRSVLSEKDVQEFERESGSKVFANLPNIDDKLDNDESISNLLIDLGFSRLGNDVKSSIFSII